MGYFRVGVRYLTNEMTKRKEPPVLYRNVQLQIETREEAGQKRHRFSISSEQPVERWFGQEVLQHTKSAIDRTFLRDGLPVFRSDKLPNFIEGGHNGRQVGIFENDAIEDKKLRGDVVFEDTDMGLETERLVEKGFRRRVSIGYSRQDYREKKEGDVITRTYTRWTPMEVHILPLGADVTVGPGRSQERQLSDEDDTEPGEPAEEVTMPKDKTRGSGEDTGTRSPETAPPAAPAVEVTDPPAPAPPPARDFSAEAAEISRIAEGNGLAARAADWIAERMTPGEVALEIVKARRTQGRGSPASEELDGLNERDLNQYSYQRAIQLAIRGSNYDGVEGEIHQELSKRLPAQQERHEHGIMVPMRLRNPQHGQRALDAATAGAGAELVGAQEVIDILRATARVTTMGAQVLTGLTAPVPFAKQTGTGTAVWVGENPGADVAESQIATGLVTLAPKTVMSATSYSRQLIMEASVDTDGLVRRDLGANHGLAVDRGALHGSGMAEPTGVYNAPDVLVKAMGGVPDYGKLIDMQGLVLDANAMMGSLGYMTTSLMAAKLRQTLEASAAGASWIWNGRMDDGEVAGYRATSTNQVRKDLGAGSNEHGLFYGNWADLVLGLWNAMELVVDPFTKARQALILLTSYQLADVILRHGQSFCKATGATVS